jgi:hypothetical protein
MYLYALLARLPLKPILMKYLMPLFVAICCPMFVFCQDITGLWKGTLYNDSTKQSLEYEIVISKEAKAYTAFSHTWFLVNGKKYYGIKKLDVHIASDGKVVIKDEKLLDNNYPTLFTQNVQQLNVLDVANIGAETTLEGPFVTKRTKKYKELTGRINLRKVNLLSQSDLMEYLQKNGEGNLTVGK